MKNYDPKKYDVLIQTQLEDYKQQFLAHPLFIAAQKLQLRHSTLLEFAFHQYSDSILWVPMLSLMKTKVAAPRLSRAIVENIKHETGLDGSSHINLARELMRSLDTKSLDSFPASTFTKSAQMWLSDGFAAFQEQEIAGWLMVAETLVPMMFGQMVGSFNKIPGANTAYFREHISVDGDEHSVWMREAVQEQLDLHGENAYDLILLGMKDAFEETLEVPNQLWEAECASL